MVSKQCCWSLRIQIWSQWQKGGKRSEENLWSGIPSLVPFSWSFLFLFFLFVFLLFLFIYPLRPSTSSRWIVSAIFFHPPGHDASRAALPTRSVFASSTPSCGGRLLFGSQKAKQASEAQKHRTTPKHLRQVLLLWWVVNYRNSPVWRHTSEKPLKNCLLCKDKTSPESYRARGVEPFYSSDQPPGSPPQRRSQIFVWNAHLNFQQLRLLQSLKSHQTATLPALASFKIFSKATGHLHRSAAKPCRSWGGPPASSKSAKLTQGVCTRIPTWGTMYSKKKI